MPTPKSIQITIPTPCTQGWGDMQPTTQGRFCQNCQHTVTDFREMSDAEIARVFLQAKGKVCGHFRPDQLGRQLRVAQPQQPMAWPRLMVGALALMLTPHFLLAQTPVKAQTQVVDGVEMPLAAKPEKKHRQQEPTTRTIQFQVVDGITEEAVPFAWIGVGLFDTVQTDANGRATFQLDMTHFKQTLMVVAIGSNLYMKKELTFDRDAIPASITLGLEIDESTLDKFGYAHVRLDFVDSRDLRRELKYARRHEPADQD